MRQKSKLSSPSTAANLQHSSIATPRVNITSRKRTPPCIHNIRKRSRGGAVSTSDDIHANDTCTLSAHFDDTMRILLDEIDLANGCNQEHSLVENYILAAMLLKGVQPTCH